MTLTEIPNEFMAGSTFDVELSFSDYPASLWTSELRLVNSTGAYSIPATSDNDAFHYLASASGTAAYSTGSYAYSIVVSSGAYVSVAGKGNLTVTPNLTTGSPVDTRSQVKQTLDAIEALIAGRVVSGVESYTVNGHSISKMNLEQLLKARGLYQQKYDKEQKEANGLTGLMRLVYRSPR